MRFITLLSLFLLSCPYAYADSTCAPAARGMELMTDALSFIFAEQDSSGRTTLKLVVRPDGIDETSLDGKIEHYDREQFVATIRSEAETARTSTKRQCQLDGEEILNDHPMRIYTDTDKTRLWIGAQDGRLHKVVTRFNETIIVTYDAIKTPN